MWKGELPPEKDPSLDELRAMAKHEVGDEVCMYGSTRWRVVGRYWSRSRRCIVYKLLFERNGSRAECAQEDLWKE